MNALLWVLLSIGGSATLEELRMMLDHRSRDHTGDIVRLAAEQGLVIPSGSTGRGVGLVRLAPLGMAFLRGRLEAPEIQARIKKNKERLKKNGTD